ncbi:MAG: HEAT repeat domain-containing protein [Pseudomonadota bacterium]
MNRRCFGTLLVVLLIPLPVALRASAEEKSQKAKVLDLLTGYEFTADKQDWDEIGQGARDILMEVFLDTGQKKIVRARAIMALRFFPDEAVKQFLLGILYKEDQDEKFLRKGLYSLSSGFGKEVLEDLATFLSHDNPDVREAAARSMGKIAGKKSLNHLKKRLKAENNEMVKKVIRQMIDSLKSELKKKND